MMVLNLWIAYFFCIYKKQTKKKLILPKTLNRLLKLLYSISLSYTGTSTRNALIIVIVLSSLAKEIVLSGVVFEIH